MFFIFTMINIDCTVRKLQESGTKQLNDFTKSLLSLSKFCTKNSRIQVIQIVSNI